MDYSTFDEFLGKIVVIKPKTSKGFTAKLVARDFDLLIFESYSGIRGMTACDSVENIVEVVTRK